LAAIDDLLVRHRVLAPRLPGTRRDADDVDDAERLGALRALRADLRRGVDRASPVDASEEDVLRDLARVVALGRVERGQLPEVGSVEDALRHLTRARIVTGEVFERA